MVKRRKRRFVKSRPLLAVDLMTDSARPKRNPVDGGILPSAMKSGPVAKLAATQR